jgi:hypothetical protein
VDKPVPGNMLAHKFEQRKAIYRAVFCCSRSAGVPVKRGFQAASALDFKPERTMNDYPSKVQS